MKKILVVVTTLIAFVLCPSITVLAQQYKLRQSTSIMGMKTESTVYVKGMRKRTESPGMMGMSPTVNIEQCDLQRTIYINDRKKRYYIEPFVSGDEENMPGEKPAPPKQKENVKQKGGVINLWYNITDTGERKKMFGFTARHVWTTQKMKPSPDACMMKDSMMVKTDGWYIDLPQFNCPVHYRSAGRPDQKADPACIDRFVTHRSGKGKLGFPLVETTTIIMGNMREVQTTVETVEFNATKLDSMLFEIPPGYEQVKSQAELQDQMNMGEMMKNAQQNREAAVMNEEKKPGMIRIGVLAPSGSDQVRPEELQIHIASSLSGEKVEAMPVSNEEEAKKYNCDYTLQTQIINLKSVSTAGGIFKAIAKADPNAASTYNIRADLTLKAMKDGTVRSVQKIDGKYEGRVNDAAGKALDEGCQGVLKSINE